LSSEHKLLAHTKHCSRHRESSSKRVRHRAGPCATSGGRDRY
jgi:hypothetical protein